MPYFRVFQGLFQELGTLFRDSVVKGIDTPLPLTI